MFYSVYDISASIKYMNVNNGKLESFLQSSSQGFKTLTWELSVL